MQVRFHRLTAAPRSPALRGSIAVVALVAAACTVGCGSSDSSSDSGSIPSAILDTGKVERSIEESILSQRHVDAKVSCPSVVPQEKGRDFNCLATVGKTKTVFAVTQTDDHGYVTYHAR